MTGHRQAKFEEDLSLISTLSPGDLRLAWQKREGAEVPRVGTALLRRLLTQRLQERRSGGLPVMVQRGLDRVAAGTEQVPAAAPSRRKLTPGARLLREWQGRTIAVAVTETGFVWEERRYASLSQIAREVTGAHWSGPRFFGLTVRG